jgi:L-arabinonolactonase
LIKSLVNTGDILGEAPVWSESERAMYWVDVESTALRRVSLGTLALDTWILPERIGSFALTRDPSVAVVALETGLYRYVFGGDLEPLALPETGAGTRFNDGKCDRRGRFWVGTMDIHARDRKGALYCLDVDGSCRPVLD